MCLFIDGKLSQQFASSHYHKDVIQVKKLVCIMDGDVYTPYRYVKVPVGEFAASQRYENSELFRIDSGAIHCIVNENNECDKFVLAYNEYIINATASLKDFVAIGWFSAMNCDVLSICFKKIHIEQSELDRVCALHKEKTG